MSLFLLIEFESMVDPNNNEYCKSKCKIQKSAKNSNCSKRWVFGNLHKHLKIHLKSYSGTLNQSQQPSTLGLNSITQSKQKELIAFFTLVIVKSYLVCHDI